MPQKIILARNTKSPVFTGLFADLAKWQNSSTNSFSVKLTLFGKNCRRKFSIAGNSLPPTEIFYFPFFEMR
jgi:hypothetical protein